MQNTELLSCELVDEKPAEIDRQKSSELLLADVTKPYVEKLCRHIPLGTPDGKSIALCTLRVVIPLTPDWIPDLPYVPLQVQGYYALLTLLVVLESSLRQEFESAIVRFFGSTKSLNNFEFILKNLRRLGVLSELWYIINGASDDEALEKGIAHLFEHLKFQNLNPHVPEDVVLNELRTESKKACAVLTTIGRYLVHVNYPTKDEMLLVKDIVGDGREWRYSFRGPLAFMKDGPYHIFG